MTDRETIEAYNVRVDAYADLTRRQSPDPALVGFIARIRPNGHVLDLGCGPASASAIMRSHGLRVDPVDASIEMVRLANANHGIGARQADFNDIDMLDTYDGVWANFSLLHAPVKDFQRHLLALHRALRRDGILHIGMKLGEGSMRDKLGRYYAYYSKLELSGHLTEAGFTIDETSTGEERGLAGDVEPWITITALA